MTRHLIRSADADLSLDRRHGAAHTASPFFWPAGNDTVPLIDYVRNVLWSFVGLGRRQDLEGVARGAHPLGLIAVAVVLAAAFVGVLLLVASRAAGA